METLIQALKNLGTGRLIVMGVIVLAVFGFFAFALSRIGTPQMTQLYTGLSMEGSAQVVKELEAQNIPYELASNGTTVLVSDDKVLQARVKLAEKGLPAGGGMGYELFDSAETLGTTNFQQQINLVRALEGELARTIRSINGVKAARVHLVLPKRQLFSREKQQPSASIILKMSSGRLGPEQIAAIQHLVATAVPDLSPGRISIVDERGSLLARGFDKGAEAGLMAAKVEQRRRQFESEMAQNIMSLVENVVGSGRVRAEVSADIDYNRVTTSAENYSPEGQVVRSSQTIESNASTSESESSESVTVATNLPDAGGSGGESASNKTSESTTEETVNYEISKTITNSVKEGGTVKRLSVAVLIDGVRTTDEEGNETYSDRTNEELKSITDLVQGAMGFDQGRGDKLTVKSMKFADVAELEEAPLELFFGLKKEDLLRIAEIIVLSIVAILVILLVVRPLVQRALEAVPSAAQMGEGLLGEMAAPALAAPVPSMPEVEEPSYDELIDIDRVEGRVKASSVKKVGEIVEKHPDEALAIIRSWMYQTD